jgi:peptide/nickel transport system permease protein
LLNPGQLVYIEKSGERPLFPHLFAPYFYSMEIFFASFFLAVAAAFIFAYLTFFLSPKWQKAVKFLAFIGESLPDVFIIIIVQLAVVMIYLKTHLLVADTAGVWGNHVYFLPILCLSLLPAFLFYRMVLLSCEEQMDMDYIELAKSKGLTKQTLLIRHITRNILVTVFFYSKSIIWLMLSNLLIVEYLFNITGITQFMFDHRMPIIYITCMLMIFVPVFFFFTLAQWLIRWLTGQKVVA